MLNKIPEISAKVENLLPTLKDEKANDKTQEFYSGLVQVIRERFNKSKNDRQAIESRWLADYRAYRGEYDSSTLARIEEDKSKVFVKITKTKVIAAFGQVTEVLFANNQFPLGVAPTIVPEGIEERVHITNEPQDPYGFAGDGKDLPPGFTVGAIELGDLQTKYGELPLKEGSSPDPVNMPELEPAKIAAGNMEKTMLDQLDATDATNHLTRAAFECCLLGSGVIKGPTSIEKSLSIWKRDGPDEKVKHTEKKVLFPEITSISVWDFFPDPTAATSKDMEWCVERHKMNASQLRKLMSMPFFSKEAIRTVLKNGPNYQADANEISLKDSTLQEGFSTLYEVLEYWGVMDYKLAEEAGLQLESELDEFDQVAINAWVCGGEILRIIANPFTPSHIPYYLVPFEIHPYQIWGIGVAENMADSQMIMNGMARMTVDNCAISGNVIFDIDENALVEGQDYKIKPGKMFRRASGQPGQAIFGINIPNTAPQNLQVFDRFRQLADEQTGIPSYSHGQTGVSGTTRTASGMSMLFGASAVNIKTVIKNFDNYCIKPLGEALFAWNMQFNENPDLPIRGDLEIRAKGTSALMQKEVRSQRLLTLLQVSQNPYIAPLIKFPTILKELAKATDLDEKEIMNDPAEAAIYARLIGTTRALSGGGPEGGGGVNGPPGITATGGTPSGASPTDSQGSGGGNIGTGNATQPGETGFPQATPQAA